MNYIIFGGSGFIGTHLIRYLIEKVARTQDRIYDLDLVLPGEQGIVPGIVENIDGVVYIRADVRKPIEFDFEATQDDVIFNLAAIHRTPGHPDYDYFDTNIHGSENVINFAEKYNIHKILFTSSIAPYGASSDLKDEMTLPTPNSPYGISKLLSEKNHEKWQVLNPNRELTILRPGVVYGKGEHGNFTRLYWGIRHRYFFYTGRKDTVKACIYVKELVRFMIYRMVENSFPGVAIFNCTYEPPYSIKQICETIMKVTGMKRHIIVIPAKLLMMAASILSLFLYRSGVHPDRVKKLMISTNISGKKLNATDFRFQYTFEESIKDWYKDCECQGLM